MAEKRRIATGEIRDEDKQPPPTARRERIAQLIRAALDNARDLALLRLDPADDLEGVKRVHVIISDHATGEVCPTCEGTGENPASAGR